MKGCDNGFELLAAPVERTKANETVKKKEKKTTETSAGMNKEKNRLQIAKEPNPPTEH